MPLFDIADVLGPAMPHLRIAAVGALWLGENMEPYDGLIAKGRATVIGFEPIREECDRLNEIRGPAHRHLPMAVGDGRRRTFYRTNAPMNSSLYRPNHALLRRFKELASIFDVVGTSEVDTVRLDDVAELGDIDFLKIDVQGAERDVLGGAIRVLQDVVMVQTEVMFVPMYEDQPLFGDIDVALRAAGFLLHQIDTPRGFALRPLIAPPGQERRFGQLLWADFVYARDFLRLDRLPPRKLLALAVLLHEVFESAGMCATVLDGHDKATGSTFRAAYLTRLTRPEP
ncbi:MAG TPA: FkbM family methyltransferase [Alphaproteobacteria bacterium]|nr:FkbM family methyltransferase [Alphaproteobacteria bacterium]